MTTFRARALLALLCVHALVACGEEAPPPAEALRPVRWTAVQLTDGVRERAFSGAAQADTESTLSFKVAGTVLELPVQVGERVAAGQVIGRLDPRDYELQVDEANASLVDAEAQAREAAANHERYRLLYEADNTSKSEYDAARAADESAAAAVTAARKRLEIAELQLGYTELAAPVDGAIASKLVDVNENIAQGEPVFELTSGSLIEVTVAVPEVLIAQIQTGRPCRVTFDALAGQEFAATVTEVGVAATGLQTTFPVKVRLDAVAEEVLPGMAANVRLQVSDPDRRARALVPAVAVSEDRAGRYAFVVVDDGPDRGRVERREVEVGDLLDGGELEVFAGLADGDRVVTRGMSKLTDGEAVLLPESGTGR